MSEPGKSIVVTNAWRSLREYTDARIGLGRSGVSLPTSELLAFQLAHARARDSVKTPLDTESLLEDLGEIQSAQLPDTIHCLQSRAPDRRTYLQRPDYGRELSLESRHTLQSNNTEQRPDLAIVIVDGLSSAAVQQHAAPFLATLLDDLQRAQPDWQLAPLTLVTQGRVAIGDDVAAAAGARMVVVLIGERPGLSSPDSLGLYFTYQPGPATRDAQRNCISNVRPRGLSLEAASHRLLYLMQEANQRQLSGVALKDRSDDVLLGSSK